MRGAGWSRVTHAFATLCAPEGALTVRLACVRHAASVHPEPGSNSPLKLSRGGGPPRRVSRKCFLVPVVLEPGSSVRSIVSLSSKDGLAAIRRLGPRFEKSHLCACRAPARPA